MNQTLRTIDGRPVLRMERRLTHPPEKVWRALTEPDQLSQWYPFRAARIELRVGGGISFDDGQGTTFDATITELDAPRVFAFSVADPDVPGGRERDNRLRFELRPDGNGCRLLFTHVFDDRPAAASYAAGWHACLDALDAVVDGRPVEMANVWVERHEAYIKAFGLDLGSAEDAPDGWRVRFERQLMRPSVDQVWATLNASGAADPAGGAPAAGGPVPQAFTSAKVPAGAVTAVEAPTLLEYDWLAEGRAAGRVRWELADGPGGARVVLTQTGPSQLTEERSTALAAWQAHIELLAKRLRQAT